MLSFSHFRVATRHKFLRIIFTLIISFSWSFSSTPVLGNALTTPLVPNPGAMIAISDPYHPIVLRGMELHPEDPFLVDFILDTGDTGLSGADLTDETTKLAKYFLAGMAVPDQDLWVNLSPFESDRVIEEAFGQTDMGRDLLAQDYLLKQITASLMYPEDETGKAFWTKVYDLAYQQYGVTNIPVDTFNKVWITPEHALVYQDGSTAHIAELKLKVQLEKDFVAAQKNTPMANIIRQTHDNVRMTNDDDKDGLSSAVMREIIIPVLEEEVNQGAHFAPLRQMVYALTLADWYKKTLKQSILTQLYADQNKVAGIDQSVQQDPEHIYQQYVRAYKEGVYNYIKEEVDVYSGETIPRQYFSGGILKAHDYTQVVAGKRGLDHYVGQVPHRAPIRFNPVGAPEDEGMLVTLSDYDLLRPADRRQFFIDAEESLKRFTDRLALDNADQREFNVIDRRLSQLKNINLTDEEQSNYDGLVAMIDRVDDRLSGDFFTTGYSYLPLFDSIEAMSINDVFGDGMLNFVDLAMKSSETVLRGLGYENLKLELLRVLQEAHEKQVTLRITGQDRPLVHRELLTSMQEYTFARGMDRHLEQLPFGFNRQVDRFSLRVTGRNHRIVTVETERTVPAVMEDLYRQLLVLLSTEEAQSVMVDGFSVDFNLKRLTLNAPPLSEGQDPDLRVIGMAGSILNFVAQQDAILGNAQYRDRLAFGLQVSLDGNEFTITKLSDESMAVSQSESGLILPVMQNQLLQSLTQVEGRDVVVMVQGQEEPSFVADRLSQEDVEQIINALPGYYTDFYGKDFNVATETMGYFISHYRGAFTLTLTVDQRQPTVIGRLVHQLNQGIDRIKNDVVFSKEVSRYTKNFSLHYQGEQRGLAHVTFIRNSSVFGGISFEINNLSGILGVVLEQENLDFGGRGVLSFTFEVEVSDGVIAITRRDVGMATHKYLTASELQTKFREMLDAEDKENITIYIVDGIGIGKRSDYRTADLTSDAKDTLADQILNKINTAYKGHVNPETARFRLETISNDSRFIIFIGVEERYGMVIQDLIARARELMDNELDSIKFEGRSYQKVTKYYEVYLDGKHVSTAPVEFEYVTPTHRYVDYSSPQFLDPIVKQSGVEQFRPFGQVPFRLNMEVKGNNIYFSRQDWGRVSYKNVTLSELKESLLEVFRANVGKNMVVQLLGNRTISESYKENVSQYDALIQDVIQKINDLYDNTLDEDQTRYRLEAGHQSGDQLFLITLGVEGYQSTVENSVEVSLIDGMQREARRVNASEVGELAYSLHVNGDYQKTVVVSFSRNDRGEVTADFDTPEIMAVLREQMGLTAGENRALSVDVEVSIANGVIDVAMSASNGSHMDWNALPAWLERHLGDLNPTAQIQARPKQGEAITVLMDDLSTYDLTQHHDRKKLSTHLLGALFNVAGDATHFDGRITDEGDLLIDFAVTATDVFTHGGIYLGNDFVEMQGVDGLGLPLFNSDQLMNVQQDFRGLEPMPVQVPYAIQMPLMSKMYDSPVNQDLPTGSDTADRDVEPADRRRS